jgi:outer membrane protein assembly factor BamB
MVVTNREPTGGSASVTKFAADPSDCIDRNGNGKIDTSTGPENVLPWGEDECMIWNTPIGGPDGTTTGARGTAWDGLEDPDTGKGGHVFVGTTMNHMVYKFDGDTGKVLAQHKIPIGAYGGVVDGKRKGGFWIVSDMCNAAGWVPGLGQIVGCALGRVDMETLETETVDFGCGYGITIDPKGRIWTAGMARCFGRYDPQTQEKKKVTGGGINRGIAADQEGSVWAANTAGSIVQVDQETMEVIKNRTIASAMTMIGIAIDYEGNVWGVAQGSSRAFKMDPKTYDFKPVPIAPQPYTYSDMTGMQLRGVVPIVVK